MQTPALPIQISGASASPAPTRATGMANTDSAQFSQALSREIGQRQQSAARAAASQATPAKVQAAAAPQPGAKPAAPAQAPAKAADARPAGEASAEEARDDAADAAAVAPVADMLALVASFNQLVAAAPVAEPAVAAAALGAALPGVPGKQARDDAGIAMTIEAAGDGAAAAVGARAEATVGAPALALKTPAGDAEPQGGAPKAAADNASSATFKAAADKAALQSAPEQPRVREADAAALKDLPAAAPLTAPAQQASAATAQAVTGAPTDRIAARVGTPGWDNQVGQKIVWMVAGKEQSASLTLNPPDMGPMQVVLNVTNDQATVTFTAAQPEVRQALEDAMPKLREMMSESGISLGNASVNAGSPEQREAQQFAQSRSNSAGGRFGGAAESVPPGAATRAVRSGDGLVDTFA